MGYKEGYEAGFAFSLASVVHGKFFWSAQAIMMEDLQKCGFKGRYVRGDMVKSVLKSFIGVPIMEAGSPK